MSDNGIENNQDISSDNAETPDNNQTASDANDNDHITVISQTESAVNDNTNLTVRNQASSNSVDNASNTHSPADLDNPEESETAIIEFLDVVKSEYEIERNKKESFENRAGIVLALISALCVFVFEKIKISDITLMCAQTMTYTTWLKITTGLITYFSLGVALICSFLTIRTKKHLNFQVGNIDLPLLKQKRLKSIVLIIKTYRDIILQHRELNENRSKTFTISLICSIISICAIAIYNSI